MELAVTTVSVRLVAEAPPETVVGERVMVARAGPAASGQRDRNGREPEPMG